MTRVRTDVRDNRTIFVVLVALILRLSMVWWAWEKIAPTADGAYYDKVARRIAEGHGYTWLWPDGAVTYAAHYPVGYPALLALAYFVFGAHPVVAMIENAALGVAGTWAGYDVLKRSTTRNLAFAGGLALAIHPAFVPYTVALMTEGPTASLLLIALALAMRARERAESGWLVGAGIVMGISVLVRPQVLIFAPLLGWFAVCSTSRIRGRNALVVLGLALLLCAPWTARNCVRMDHCALVSVNGGWNLAIGTQTTTGAWQELAVPKACANVFAEAAKDACFGRVARADILAHRLAWLERMPSKIRVTFDYFGAAPWYLHAASPAYFSYDAKVWLGAIETLTSRLLLISALVSVRKFDGPRRRWREAVTALGLIACVLPVGTVGYLACGLAIVLLGIGTLSRMSLLVPWTAAVVLGTAATHAVFFGAGRYGLVVLPFVTLLAFVRTETPA